jgi:hypothetical protein
MSCGSGSTVIPVAVFLAILFVVLPVSASNATPATTIATMQTTNATPATTVVTTQTTNATPAITTVAVTQPATVVTSANPTLSVTETGTTGNVMIYSSPTGARILIDGFSCGTTPGNVNGVPAGNHILRLTLSGYYDYEGSIYIVPGQTAQGYGTLQPMSQVTSAAPTPVPTVIVPVIVPVVTATPEPAKDPGLPTNPTVLAAIIGSVAVIIGSCVTIYNHVRPPKKE